LSRRRLRGSCGRDDPPGDARGREGHAGEGKFRQRSPGGVIVRIEEYKEHLQGRGVSAEEVDKQEAIIRDFVGFLTDEGLKETAATAGKSEAQGFARRLIAGGRNTPESFAFLRKYADWLGNRPLYVALIELTDCHNAMPVLAGEIESRHGREVRERIFREAMPPLGADEEERWVYTRTIVERMAGEISPEEARAAWFKVQHGISVEDWRESDAADRDKYRRCGGIDEFLDLQRQERDAFLTRLRDDGKLWYTVVINDEVLDFIKSDPEMEVGRREGDKVYITKVPYNAVRYLHATDARMKRYYACHCPLVREALLGGEPISPEVCNCSLGHASHYLAGLDRDLRGEVLESAVRGDTRCRFVFHLPNRDGERG